MSHAAKEVFENNMHHYNTTKTFAKAYLISRVLCTRGSLPYFARNEPVRGIFLVVSIVNKNLPE